MNIHDQWSDDHWFLFCQKTGKNGVKASSSASTDPIKLIEKVPEKMAGGS